MAASFHTAVRHHQEGRLEQAELIYRQILDDDPDHAGALHLLGVIAHQRGQSEEAIQLITRALVLQPTMAVFHCNLAEALRVAGKPAEAAAHSQKAIQLQPANADAHNQLGLALHAQLELTEAIASYREAIRLRADFGLAWNNLGNALREAGQPDEALAALREAVRQQPNLAMAHSNLGQLLLEMGRRDDALAHCREAVRLQPDFPESLSNLGNVLRAMDNLAEAKECYQKALQLRPGLAIVHGNLGQACQEEGNLDQAIGCYEKSLRLDPQSARVESFLASALVDKEKPKEAMAHFRRALEIQANFPEALNGLGHLLQEEGDHRAALECYDEALRHKPDFADAHSNRGGVLAELGELEAALASYRAALDHDPEYMGAYGVLATHLRNQLPAEDVERMEQFLQREHLSEWKRSLLHHGLAHVADAQLDFAAAAEHARQANEHRKQVWLRQGKNYDRKDHVGYVLFLIKQFSAEFFERVRCWGLDTEVPVFIFGLPRSGTTLLEQVLASHPQVFGAGELPYTKETFDSVPSLMKSDPAPAACMTQISREVLQQAGGNHLQRLRNLNGEAARIVDKMPDNYLWLGFLAATFPRARFIFSRRDVRDVAVSCWITNFRQIRWACDQEDIAYRILCHLRLMNHWRQVLPAPILEVDYEAMVANLEEEARRMIAFCGLDWDPACLAFHEAKRTVRTASLTQVRQPVHSRSVQRWKNYETALAPVWRVLEENEAIKATA